MKRALPLVLLLALVGVVLFILSQDGSEKKDTDPITIAQGDDGPEAATFDQEGPTRVGPVEEEEPYDHRMTKVGLGRFGLYGTVVDERGAPLPNMWVGAYSAAYPFFDFEVDLQEIVDHPLSFELEPIAATMADENGKFQLEGLPGRGTFLVARGSLHLTRGRQEVSPSDLDSEEGVLLHTVPGASLSGDVIDENGAPVANAEVFLAPDIMYAAQAIRNRDIYFERLFTDGAGHYELDVVPAGMKLSVIALDGATHPGMRSVGPLPGGGAGKATVQLTEVGSLTGVVQNEDGEAIRNAKVVAIPLDLRMIVGFVRDIPAYTTLSGSDGSFAFPELPRRNVIMFAQGREGRSIPTTSAVTGAESTMTKPIVVKNLYDLKGRVIDEKGNGLGGVRVALKSIPSESDDLTRMRGGMPSGSQLLLQAASEILPELLPDETWMVTDSAGRFRLPAWRGASLRVSAEGYAEAVYNLTGIPEDKEAALLLFKPGSISGKVTVASTGDAMPFFVLNAKQNKIAMDPEANVDVDWEDGDDWRSFRDRRDAAEAQARSTAFVGVIRDDEHAILPEQPTMSELMNTQFHDEGDGTFTIENLTPGTWRVEARADGFIVERENDIVVNPGEETKDVVLGLERGATLSGRVVAYGTREAVPNALVTIGDSKESGLTAYFQMGMETTALARSDLDGNFTLEGIKPGLEWVHVMAEGFSPTAIKGRPLEADEVRDEVVIQVRQGGTIQGQVIDRHGVPLPARMVVGVSPDSQDFWQAATDVDGNYKAEHVKPGSYFLVTAALDDEALYRADFMSILGGSRMAQAFVKEGETVTIDIEDLSAGGTRFTGRIMASGEPIANAAIFAMAADSGGIFDIRMATARADEEGEFLFKSLAPGTYNFMIQGSGWNGSIEVDVPDVPEHDATLETPTGRVRGRVVEEATGVPVEGATAQLVFLDQSGGMFAMFMDGNRSEWESTDENGYYEFENIPEGRFRVEVDAGGWRSRDRDSTSGGVLGKVNSREFSLIRNDDLTLENLELPVGSAIKALVTGSDGKDIERGFSIRAVPNDTSDGASEEEDWGWGGEGTLNGLMPGTYTVTVSADGYMASRMENVVVGYGETTEVSFTLDKGVRLSARLLNANGQPISGAKMQVFDTNGKRVDGLEGRGATFSSFFASEDGTTPLGSFREGTYTVRAEYEGTTREKTVSLNSQDPGLVEFRF
jgi:protocatechuate 3,4-dioxygenase beta subunit